MVFGTIETGSEAHFGDGERSGDQVRINAMSVWWGSVVVPVSRMRNSSREAVQEKGSVWLPCLSASELFEENETRIRA